MGRPTLAETKDTRNDLIRVALEMIQTRGFSAFSYQDLADRLGLRKASIHYHFKTKEDLGVGLLEFGLQRFTDWKKKVDAQALSPETKIEAYFDYFAEISASGTKICPCGALTSQWGSLPAPVQEAATRLLTAHRDWARKVIEAGRSSGDFAKNGTADEQAQFVFASLQGALQTARALNNPGYFRAVTRQLLTALKAK